MPPDPPPACARRRLQAALALGLILFLHALHSTSAGAQTITLTGGSLTLRINSAVPGNELDEETDDTTVLDWEGGGSTAKITVETDCPGQSFSLYVQATIQSGGGTAQGEVALTHLVTHDLIRGIPHNGSSRTGRATLGYRAVATVNQGTSLTEGDDVHQVTYTILAQ